MARPRARPKSIVVLQKDLYLFLVASVRYALGRATYIVGETIDAIVRYWDYLTPEQRKVIHRDIYEELQRADSMNHKLGHQIDHDSWVAIEKSLAQLLKKEEQDNAQRT